MKVARNLLGNVCAVYLVHLEVLPHTFFFLLCSYRTKDGGQNQVFGCTHHPPLMRNPEVKDLLGFDKWNNLCWESSGVHLYFTCFYCLACTLYSTVVL